MSFQAEALRSNSRILTTAAEDGRRSPRAADSTTQGCADSRICPGPLLVVRKSSKRSVVTVAIANMFPLAVFFSSPETHNSGHVMQLL